VRELLKLYTRPLNEIPDRKAVPAFLAFLLGLPLGVPLAVLSFLVVYRLPEDVYNKLIPVLFVEVLAIVFVPGFFLMWVFTKVSRRRAIQSHIRKIVQEYPRQVEHWGGEAALHDVVQLRELVRLLDRWAR